MGEGGEGIHCANQLFCGGVYDVQVVNVYRLITRGTLEEKIMSLQKFKINIANTVISKDNASLGSMGTDQLLDLFHVTRRDDVDTGGGGDGGDDDDVVGGSGGLGGFRAVAKQLGDAWDQSQYDAEFDLDTFLASMRS